MKFPLRIRCGLKNHISHQFLLKMKLTMILLIAVFLQVQAEGYSQQINISQQNAKLEDVFIQIMEQTDYHFLYFSPILKNAKPVNVELKDATLTEALNQCFTGQPLTYVLDNNTIIVKLIPPPPFTIKGKVTDAKGEAIPGVTVLVKGTNKGTATDGNGYYEIQVTTENKTLIFSGIGLKKQEIAIRERTIINLTMEEEITELNQVVVNGMFIQKASTYTGSAFTVGVKELQQNGNRNIISTLRNVDPSFNVVENNSFGSDPNRLPEIQIRGNSSLPNVNQIQDQTRVGMNTPLIILDGFESTLQKLLNMNENEVQTITILHDASATAIYCSRGANGVVVIQTKAPAAGKLRITYRSDLNIERPDLSTYNLLNAQDKLDLELKVGIYDHGRITNDITLKRYYAFLRNEANSGVNTDWMSIPLRTGIGQRHNIRLEGGDQSFRYSASLQKNDQQGVMKGSSRNTFNGTVNLMYTYKTIKFTNQLIVAFENTTNSPYGLFSDYVKMNPYWRPYDTTGRVTKLLGNSENSDYTSRWSVLPANPLYNATLNGFDKSNTSSIVNNFSIEWTIVKDLLLRSRIGLTKDVTQLDKFRSADNTAFENYPIADVFRKGDYSYGIGNGFSYDGSISLNYAKTIAKKHYSVIGLDYNMRQNKLSNYNFLAEGFSNVNFDFISMALQYAKNGKPSGTENLSRSVGLTGNLNYCFDNRYYTDFSFRIDGSSQFGTNKRFAPFWSSGIGWNLHQEDFLKNSKTIDMLRIRASMGVTGSQSFNSYQALSTYRYYSNDRYYSGMGAYLMGLGNEDLRWQQKMNYNIGIETHLINQRYSFALDYYLGQTKDLVSSVNLPLSNGFPYYIENSGKMENRGFELKASAFILRNYEQGISWNVSTSIFKNTNKIVKISQALKDAQTAIVNAGGSNPNILYREGYSTNTIWVVQSLGIDPSTGKEIFLDMNNEPTYIWSSKDLRPIGVTDPKLQGNLSSMIRYKGLSLNIVFGFRYGGQLYNSTLINKVENADYSYNVDSRVYEARWQKPGDIVDFKSLNITSSTQMTSRFVQDEKTISCQNINLSYEVKTSRMKNKLGIETLLFSANMANLFYTSSVKQERGIDYPFSHSISFSVSAIF